MVDDVLRVRRSSQRTAVSLKDTMLSRKPAGHAGRLAGVHLGRRVWVQSAWKPSRVQSELVDLQGEGAGREGAGRGTEDKQGWEVAARAWGGLSSSPDLFLDVETRLSGLRHDLGAMELAWVPFSDCRARELGRHNGSTFQLAGQFAWYGSLLPALVWKCWNDGGDQVCWVR